MHHFSNAGQPFASATVTVSAHVCEELLKLHSIDSHDNPLIVEMSKSPLEQSNHYFQLPLQSHQSTVTPIRVIHSYENAVNLMRTDIALFANSIPKGMRMKNLDMPIS